MQNILRRYSWNFCSGYCRFCFTDILSLSVDYVSCEYKNGDPALEKEPNFPLSDKIWDILKWELIVSRECNIEDDRNSPWIIKSLRDSSKHRMVWRLTRDLVHPGKCTFY